MKKEAKNILNTLRKAGWRIERRSKHWMAFSPDKSIKPITIGENPSDRNLNNLRAEMKRKGVNP